MAKSKEKIDVITKTKIIICNKGGRKYIPQYERVTTSSASGISKIFSKPEKQKEWVSFKITPLEKEIIESNNGYPDRTSAEHCLKVFRQIIINNT